jgi:hypothetical protein
MEIHYEFDSSLIPLVSKLAPSDTIKIWKVGSSVRCDLTLVGYKSLRSKRRNLSIIFRDVEKVDWHGSGHLDKDIILINHSKKIIVNPMEEPDYEEKLAILNDLTRVSPV